MSRSFVPLVVLTACLVATRPAPPAQSQALQPEERLVDVGGQRIHLVDWGGPGKPPMVMVHGLDRVARTFDHMARHFAATYRVIAIDMRGHGDSGWDPQGRYLVEDHVGDLEGVVTELALGRLVLWGNSTGGRVVQVFAGRHPELVTHVISEDVGPERPRQIADSYSRRVQQEQAGWASADELRAQLRKSNPRMVEEVLDAYVRYGTRTRQDGQIT